MNKYSCSFTNGITEELYQNNQQQPQRKFQMRIFNLSATFILILRIATVLLNYTKGPIYPHIIMLVFIVGGIFVKTEKRLRISISIVNILFTYYVVTYYTNPTQIGQNINGCNQMAVNFLQTLILEFPEATLVTLANLGIRFVYFMMLSSSEEIEVMIVSVMMHFIWIYYLYSFHKARRSQFLLTLVDNKWDLILQQILKNKQHFLLLHFNVETLKIDRTISTINFQEEISTNQFLNEAKFENQPLINYLFQKIKNFKEVQKEVINIPISLKYKKNIINFHLSLFFGAQPIILLIQINNLKFNQLTTSQSTLFLKMLKYFKDIILLNRKYDQKKFFQLCQIIEIKFILSKILDQKQQLQIINLCQYVDKVAQFYQTQLPIHVQGMDFHIQTQPDVIYLLLVLIFNHAKSRVLSIEVVKGKNQLATIFIDGKFKDKQLRQSYQKLQSFFSSVVLAILIYNESVEIDFLNEGLISYTIADLQW